MEGLLLVAVVLAVLYGLWTLLGVIFDRIDHWHAAHRREDSSANREKVRSDF